MQQASALPGCTDAGSGIAGRCGMACGRRTPAARRSCAVTMHRRLAELVVRGVHAAGERVPHGSTSQPARRSRVQPSRCRRTTAPLNWRSRVRHRSPRCRRTAAPPHRRASRASGVACRISLSLPAPTHAPRARSAGRAGCRSACSSRIGAVRDGCAETGTGLAEPGAGCSRQQSHAGGLRTGRAGQESPRLRRQSSPWRASARVTLGGKALIRRGNLHPAEAPHESRWAGKSSFAATKSDQRLTQFHNGRARENLPHPRAKKSPPRPDCSFPPTFPQHPQPPPRGCLIVQQPSAFSVARGPDLTRPPSAASLGCSGELPWSVVEPPATVIRPARRDARCSAGPAFRRSPARGSERVP